MTLFFLRDGQLSGDGVTLDTDRFVIEAINILLYLILIILNVDKLL